MADYITQFIVGFELTTDKQRAFWAQAWEDLGKLEELPEDPAERLRLERLYGDQLLTYIDEGGMLGLDIDLDATPGMLPFDRAYVSDNAGHGNPHAAGLLCSAYLRACGDDGVVAFQYANTCSKHRFDGFGGGWVHVRHDYVEVHDTFSMMEDAVGSVSALRNTEES